MTTELHTTNGRLVSGDVGIGEARLSTGANTGSRDTGATGSRGRSKRRGKVVVTAKNVSQARVIITSAMGCGIPLLSLALSHMGGELLVSECYVLGVTVLGLCCTVLGVSLSHLAWAIRDITRSAWWQSWCLAVATDCTLVACELAGVLGHDGWIRLGVMLCVTAASMCLNCWAFFRHK